MQSKRRQDCYPMIQDHHNRLPKIRNDKTAEIFRDQDYQLRISNEYLHTVHGCPMELSSKFVFIQFSFTGNVSNFIMLTVDICSM